MSALFKGITKSDIIVEPYPHVVVKNVLPKELADHLLNNFPTIEHVDQKAVKLSGLSMDEYPENKIFCTYGKDILKDALMDGRLKEFFSEHASFEFFKEIVSLFEDHLKAEFPEVLKYVRSIKNDEVGVIHEQYETPKKLIIDGGLCLGTPARTENLRSSIHLDNPKKVCGVILYLKHPEDMAPGGEFNMYATPKEKIIVNQKMVVKDEYIKTFDGRFVKSLPYEHNTLLIFLNSPRAFHAVAPRFGAKHLRYTVNLAFNVDKPVFDFSKYMEFVLTRKLRSLLFYLRKFV